MAFGTGSGNGGRCAICHTQLLPCVQGVQGTALAVNLLPLKIEINNCMSSFCIKQFVFLHSLAHRLAYAHYISLKMQIHLPSILILAVLLAVTQSTISHPIRTSKWVKKQIPDSYAGGIWKVFEKEEDDLLPDPPHVKYNGVSPRSYWYIVDSATYQLPSIEPSMANQPK